MVDTDLMVGIFETVIHISIVKVKKYFWPFFLEREVGFFHDGSKYLFPRSVSVYLTFYNTECLKIQKSCIMSGLLSAMSKKNRKKLFRIL